MLWAPSSHRACVAPSAPRMSGIRRGVMGDRRLVRGQWGGSVLDSVVGVFLTQNVSDALSSKAWMSLAATFPLPASQQDGIDSMDWEAVRTAPVGQVMLQNQPAALIVARLSANWKLGRPR